MKKVKLTRDAGPYKRGETVEVDDQRAAQWEKDGYVAKPQKEKK